MRRLPAVQLLMEVNGSSAFQATAGFAPEETDDEFTRRSVPMLGAPEKRPSLEAWPLGILAKSAYQSSDFLGLVVLAGLAVLLSGAGEAAVAC